ELDFGLLLTRKGARASAREAPQGPAAAAPRMKPGNEASKREDKVQAGSSAVASGFKHGGGRRDWADDPIDLTPLGLADADLTLSAERVVYKDVTTGQARLTLSVKDRVGRLTLDEMLLYSGRGKGVLTLDGSGQVPVTAADLRLEGVSAAPLLRDALGMDWLDGRSTIVVGIAGQGSTERRIV